MTESLILPKIDVNFR